MKWQRDNPERAKALNKASRDRVINDPKRLKRRRANTRRYYYANKANVVESHRKWRAKNEWAVVADRCRSLLRNAVRVASIRCPNTEMMLGCSIFEFREKLEAQWKVGMNWGNFGRGGWTLSHKRPVAEFKEVLLTEEGKKECFHWSNLMPEWEADNRAKHVRTELTLAQKSVN